MGSLIAGNVTLNLPKPEVNTLNEAFSLFWFLVFESHLERPAVEAIFVNLNSRSPCGRLLVESLSLVCCAWSFVCFLLPILAGWLI